MDSYRKGIWKARQIECPLHAGIFDVTSGAPMTPPPDESVPVYRVKVEGVDIMIAPS